MMGSRSSIKHIGGLDGLRGLAALAVFGVHLNQNVQFDMFIGPVDVATLLANGERGVSVFFTLSGLLLSVLFWQAKADNQKLPDLKKYTVRRLARILPAYYVALTLLLYMDGLWRVPGAGADIALHYTFLFNFAEFSIFSINPVFWTIAVEMQFYLLLPLIFLLIRKLSVRKGVLLILTMAMAAYLLHFWLMRTVDAMVFWPSNPWLIWLRPNGAVLYHSLAGQLPLFLLGLVAGYLYLRIREKGIDLQKKFQWLCEIGVWGLFGGALVLILTGWEEFLQLPSGPYGFPGVPLILALMILCIPFSRHAKRLLDSPPLRWLGLISYSLYLFHVPCLNLVYRYLSGQGIDISVQWGVFGAVSLGLSLLVATISYLLIEKPVMRLARKWA